MPPSLFPRACSGRVVQSRGLSAMLKELRSVQHLCSRNPRRWALLKRIR
jgi:hypothetical protein